MKRRKRTPEEIDAYRRFREDSHRHDRRLRELVAKGLAELDEKRTQERRESS